MAAILKKIEKAPYLGNGLILRLLLGCADSRPWWWCIEGPCHILELGPTMTDVYPCLIGRDSLPMMR